MLKHIDLYIKLSYNYNKIYCYIIIIDWKVNCTMENDLEIKEYKKVRIADLIDTFVFDDQKMDDILSEIRRNLIDLRKKRNLNLSEMGNLSNVSIAQIYKIENGVSTPSFETLIKFAVVLQVPLSEIIPCEILNKERETLGAKIDKLTQHCSRKVKNHILRICTELVQFDKNYDKVKR